MNAAKGSYSYAGAGYEGYLLDADANLKKRPRSTGPPLGWFSSTHYEYDEVGLTPGDILIQMTDGLSETVSAGAAQRDDLTIVVVNYKRK